MCIAPSSRRATKNHTDCLSNCVQKSLFSKVLQSFEVFCLHVCFFNSFGRLEVNCLEGAVTVWEPLFELRAPGCLVPMFVTWQDWLQPLYFNTTLCLKSILKNISKFSFKKMIEILQNFEHAKHFFSRIIGFKIPDIEDDSRKYRLTYNSWRKQSVVSLVDLYESIVLLRCLS